MNNKIEEFDKGRFRINILVRKDTFKNDLLYREVARLVMCFMFLLTTLFFMFHLREGFHFLVNIIELTNSSRIDC